MATQNKKYIYLAILFVAIVTAFSTGFIFGAIEKLPHPVQGIINKEFGQPKEFDFSLFWKTWDELHNKFVDQDKLKEDSLLYGAISGMVNGAGDPYTVFFPPVETKSFKQDVGGSFGGIGAEIGKRNGASSGDRIAGPAADRGWSRCTAGALARPRRASSSRGGCRGRPTGSVFGNRHPVEFGSHGRGRGAAGQPRGAAATSRTAGRAVGGRWASGRNDTVERAALSR